MNTWEEFDTMVTNDIATNPISIEMLRAHLFVLLAKNMITYQTSLEEIQRILRARYDVEYKLSDIEDELIDIRHTEEKENLGNDVIELEEDFFEGY